MYDGNGRHTYIMYETTNKSGKQQHKLLATSHYYDPDKVTKIRKKNAILMKFADLSEYEKLVTALGCTLEVTIVLPDGERL